MPPRWGVNNKVSLIIRTYTDHMKFIASFIFFLFYFFIYHIFSYSFRSIVCHCIYGCMFCGFCLILYIMYSYYVYVFFCYVYVFLLLCLCNIFVYVFLLLCMFRSVYSVSLCCSVYCWCVNVYCTAATVCQPNCSYQIYHIISIS
jgi:hypothetical protein